MGPMKLASIIVVGVALTACGGGTVPSSPTPPPAPVVVPPVPAPPVPTTGPALLWVMVLNVGGSCVPGGTVDVIIDGAVVQSGPQATPCDYWDDGGGILFKNLPVAEVTLRGGADGYVTREIQATGSTGSYSVTAITLERVPTAQQGRQ